MRTFAILAIVAVVLMGLATTANAQGEFELGIFFDTAATQPEGIAPGFATTTLYLLMVDLGGQIIGYELGVYITPDPDSVQWVITRGTPSGLDIDPDPDGYVVGLATCDGSQGGILQLNTYDLSYFGGTEAPSDTYLCLGPPKVNNPSIPGLPSYQRCGIQEVFPAGFHVASNCPGVEDGCAVVNPTNPGCMVATEETSFGAIKAKY